MIINVCVAQSAGGGVRLVVYDRVRHVDALPTRKLSAKTQIGVFVVEKKIFIQKSDFVEHLSAVQHRGSARAENPLRTIVQSTVRAEPTIKTDGGRRQPIAGAVDSSATVEEKFGGADRDTRVSVHRLNQIFQPPIIRASIVIDKGDELSVSDLQPFHIAAGETGIFPQLDNFHIGKFFSDVAYGGIRRAVVH